MPAPPAGHPSELLVACLCAQWCGVCRQWRTDFEGLAQNLPDATWLWVDVERHAEALGQFEPENFPVLAVQRAESLLYCAALPQQPQPWLRMIRALDALDAEQIRLWASRAPQVGLDLRRLRHLRLPGLPGA